MGKNIEAEGGELVLQNANGDKIVVPKNKRKEALKMLEDNNHSGIDDLATSLPYMEDYAENGTLIPDGFNTAAPIDPVEPVTPPTTTDTDTNIENVPKGIFSEKQFEDLSSKYASGKMANWEDSGCLGSTCRNLQSVHPQLKDYYTELRDVGAYEGKGIQSPYDLVQNQEKAKKGNLNEEGFSGVDSWEIHQFLREKNLGETSFMFTPDQDDERRKAISELDYTSLPVGSLLGFGDAQGVYVNPGTAKKGETTPRHSASVLGYVEGMDDENNPTVDIVVDDLGIVHRIGKSTEAGNTWENYAMESQGGVNTITSRKSLGDWDYSKLKGTLEPGKKPIKFTKTKSDRTTEEILTDMKQIKEDFINAAKSDVEAGEKTEADLKKVEELTGQEMYPELMEELAKTMKIPGTGGKKKK